MEGAVKRWLGFREYGFLRCDEIEGDVFVHHSAFKGRRYLLEGEKVG